MRPYKIKHLAMRFTSSKCCRCWNNGDFRCFVRYFLEVLLGQPQWHMARGNFQNSHVRAATRKWSVIMVFCLSPEWGCSPAKRPKFSFTNHLLPGMIHQGIPPICRSPRPWNNSLPTLLAESHLLLLIFLHQGYPLWYPRSWRRWCQVGAKLENLWRWYVTIGPAYRSPPPKQGHFWMQCHHSPLF